MKVEHNTVPRGRYTVYDVKMEKSEYAWPRSQFTWFLIYDYVYGYGFTWIKATNCKLVEE